MEKIQFIDFLDEMIILNGYFSKFDDEDFDDDDDFDDEDFDDFDSDDFDDEDDN